MRPRFELLDQALIDRVVDEALALLAKPGIKVEEPEAIRVLVGAGATADGNRVFLTEAMVRRALDTVPHAFDLYTRDTPRGLWADSAAILGRPDASATATRDVRRSCPATR